MEIILDIQRFKELEGITFSQYLILAFLEGKAKIEDIEDVTGLTSLNIFTHLQILEKEGWLRNMGGGIYVLLPKAQELFAPGIPKGLEGFDEFWDKYHELSKKAKTDKEPTKKKWKALNKTERGLALSKCPEYIKWALATYGSLQYIKKARTYLEDKEFLSTFETPKSNRVVGL